MRFTAAFLLLAAALARADKAVDATCPAVLLFPNRAEFTENKGGCVVASVRTPFTYPPPCQQPKRGQAAPSAHPFTTHPPVVTLIPPRPMCVRGRNRYINLRLHNPGAMALQDLVITYDLMGTVQSDYPECVRNGWMGWM